VVPGGDWRDVPMLCRAEGAVLGPRAAVEDAERPRTMLQR